MRPTERRRELLKWGCQKTKFGVSSVEEAIRYLVDYPTRQIMTILYKSSLLSKVRGSLGSEFQGHLLRIKLRGLLENFIVKVLLATQIMSSEISVRPQPNMTVEENIQAISDKTCFFPTRVVIMELFQLFRICRPRPELVATGGRLWNGTFSHLLWLLALSVENNVTKR